MDDITSGEEKNDPILAEAIFNLVQELKQKRLGHGSFYGTMKMEINIQNGLCVNSEVSVSVKKMRGKEKKS